MDICDVVATLCDGLRLLFVFAFFMPEMYGFVYIFSYGMPLFL